MDLPTAEKRLKRAQVINVNYFSGLATIKIPGLS